MTLLLTISQLKQAFIVVRYELKAIGHGSVGILLGPYQSRIKFFQLTTNSQAHANLDRFRRFKANSALRNVNRCRFLDVAVNKEVNSCFYFLSGRCANIIIIGCHNMSPFLDRILII